MESPSHRQTSGKLRSFAGKSFSLCHSHRSGRVRTAGQAIVETALVLPIMISMMTLAAFVGQMTAAGIDATTAARAAATGASYAWWQVQPISAQAPIAVQWACKEASGSGATCSEKSCSKGASSNIYVCTFSGTTPYQKLTLTDAQVDESSTTVNVAEVQLTLSVTPFVDVAGSVTVMGQAGAMQEQ